MSLLTYKKFKVIINGDSPKENGLQYGDVVIRKYLENNTSYYSVLHVDEIGTTQVTINGELKSEKWFDGSLIYGDDPLTGQPLDFTRITSLSNVDRMGALYLTSIDNDAPYLDIVDRIGIDGSINYPRYIGTYGVYDKYAYSIYGSQYFSSLYIESSGSENRIIRITKNSTAIPVGESVLLSLPTLKGSYADQKVIISYKYRTSSNYDLQTSVSDGNGAYELMSSTINSGIEFKKALNLFSVSNIHTDSYFKIDLSQLSVDGEWIEISDLNIIPLNELTSWSSQTKTRIGKLSGLSDPVFGTLRDYGAYIQRIYASKDVNISGTLTAGDKNGFGATFYAGKIHKNVVIDSMNHDWDLAASEDLIQINPVGIGKVFKLSDMSLSGSNHRFTYNTQEWYQSHIGEEYTFSAWFKSGSGVKSFSFDDNDSDAKSFSVSENWERIQFNFIVGSDVSNNYCFVDVSGADTDNDFYICGMQVEKGEYATAYQPTDGTITPEDNSYGVWMARGGIGGTIQNPLLKLMGNGDIRSRGDRFYITVDGNAYFEGNITAGSGNIGGWTISAVSIFSGVENNTFGGYTSASGSITIGSNGLRGFLWRFENDGSGALAGGKISFGNDGSALIGTWKIDVDSIYSGIKKAEAGFSSSGITIHSSGAIRAMYARIETDGKLYATNADIAGKITASSGEIGAWKIDSNSFYSGTKATNNASFTASDGSITIWSSGAISARYCRIGTDGKIYASNADLSGKITASSGQIGNWAIENNSLVGNVIGLGLGIQIRTDSIGSGYWYTGGYRPAGFSLIWNQSSNAGHIVIGQVAETRSTAKAGFYGIQMMDYLSNEYFCLSANVAVEGTREVYNRIAGWEFNSTSIKSPLIGGSGRIELHALSNKIVVYKGGGSVNTGPRVQMFYNSDTDYGLYAEGEGTTVLFRLGSTNKIANWNLDGTAIWTGTKKDTAGYSTDGITIHSSGAIRSMYARIETDGKLYASSADLSGKITASSGAIGPWNIDSTGIYNTYPGVIGDFLQIRSSNSGSGLWYTGAYKPKGFSILWHQSSNAGHIVVGQIAATASSAKTGYMGIQMMDYLSNEYFCLSASVTLSGSQSFYNRIAGWSFDKNKISKGQISINSSTNKIVVFATNGSETSGGRAQMYYNSDADFGFYASNVAGSRVFITGAINNIAGWTFDNASIYSGTKAASDTSYTTVANSITMWSSGAMSGRYWKITPDGKFYATDGYFSGEIHASSGTIGGFTINADGIGSATISGTTRMYMSDDYVRVGSTDNLFSAGQNAIPSGMSGFNAMTNVFIRNISLTTGTNKAGIIVDLGNTTGASNFGFITNSASYGASFIETGMHYVNLNSTNSGSNSYVFWDNYKLSQRNFIMIYSYADYTLYLPGQSQFELMFPTTIAKPYCIRFTIHNRKSNGYNVTIGSTTGAETYNQNGDLGSRALGRGDMVEFAAIHDGSSFYYQVLGFTYGM